MPMRLIFYKFQYNAIIIKNVLFNFEDFFFQINNAKDHFPILGICLGFELILVASIDGKFPFKKCSASGLNLPLKLIPRMEEKSVLFRTMPKDIRKILLTEHVTANHHRYVLIIVVC